MHLLMFDMLGKR
ncbi:Protein of unknown function [Bacillus wiedmannii]|nr:Protein of unknown function [Bacillus wiedmannii]